MYSKHDTGTMDWLTDRAVLDVGDDVAVRVAGKLLAGLGATVTKIEPPDGDVSRRVGPFIDGADSIERTWIRRGGPEGTYRDGIPLDLSSAAIELR